MQAEDRLNEPVPQPSIYFFRERAWPKNVLTRGCLAHRSYLWFESAKGEMLLNCNEICVDLASLTSRALHKKVLFHLIFKLFFLELKILGWHPESSPVFF